MKLLKINKLNSFGMGTTEQDGKTFIIPKTMPGDEVLPKKTESKKNAEIVKKFSLKKPSSKRINPSCPFFKKCGGCEWQHIPYSMQIKFKTERVRKLFKEKLNIEEGMIKETIPAKQTLWYRNKIRHSFVNDNGKVSLARHAPFESEGNVPIDECLLMSKKSNAFCDLLVEFVNREKIGIFPEGPLKFVNMREGKNSNEFMAELVVAEPFTKKKLNALVKTLVKNMGDLRSLYLSEVEGDSNMIKKRRLLYGRKFIREYLNCGKKDKIVTNRFNISPGSFFQTNPRQAEVLYNNIIQLANLKGREIVFDLYSGTGTIAIILAQFARRIYAIEEERESVVDAKQNAKMNKARNVTFLKGDALSEARKLAKRKIYPDLAVIDPPRSGLSENAMRKLLEIIPPRIIYVSCNPRTLVRDLEVLQMNKFKVLSVQPIDMFPQTSHVEVMVDLEWEGQVTSGK